MKTLTKIDDGVYEYEGHRIEVRRRRGAKAGFEVVVATPTSTSPNSPFRNAGETWVLPELRYGTKDAIAREAACSIEIVTAFAPSIVAAIPVVTAIRDTVMGIGNLIDTITKKETP